MMDVLDVVPKCQFLIEKSVFPVLKRTKRKSWDD